MPRPSGQIRHSNQRVEESPAVVETYLRNAAYTSQYTKGAMISPERENLDLPSCNEDHALQSPYRKILRAHFPSHDPILSSLYLYSLSCRSYEPA